MNWYVCVKDEALTNAHSTKQYLYKGNSHLKREEIASREIKKVFLRNDLITGNLLMNTANCQNMPPKKDSIQTQACVHWHLYLSESGCMAV